MVNPISLTSENQECETQQFENTPFEKEKDKYLPPYMCCNLFKYMENLSFACTLMCVRSSFVEIKEFRESKFGISNLDLKLYIMSNQLRAEM